jgi:sec-independent protein translocase protein TatC
MSEPATSEAEREGMPLLEHLDELRGRLFKSVLAFVVALAACAAFGSTLLEILLRPVQGVLPEGERLSFIRLAEPFLVQLKAAALVAVFLAAPVILYQVWAFVSPGLYRHERRWIWPFLAFGSLFFAAGGYFGYRVVGPMAAQWLIGVGEGYDNTVTLQEAFGFVGRIVLGMGLVFELPIVIFFLARIGVVTPAFLLRHFRIVVLLVAVVAAVVTPPDPASMILFAVPMLVLYLLGVAVAWVFRKRDGADGSS